MIDLVSSLDAPTSKALAVNQHFGDGNEPCPGCQVRAATHEGLAHL